MVRRGLTLPDSAVSQKERARRAAERERCAADIAYWCDRYVQTYDPRLRNPQIPFRLFPRQAEFLRWVAERRASDEGGLVEKSRDSGLTWLCCVYAVHAWLFGGQVSIGFGSRKLELVDKIGDPDSILEKCRIILRNLPAWMLPPGFSVGKHAGYCKIVNTATKATITGEGGDNIGRGGRKAVYFVDEAAFIERPHLVDAALSHTTRCRIDVSTPNGNGNAFFKKRFSGRVPVFTFHWRDDPRKDEAWYQKQKLESDPVVLAQEVDIDYSASVEGICIPAEWVKAAINLPLKASGPRVAGYDVADEGQNRNVLVPRQGPVFLAPESWKGLKTTASAYKSREIAERLGLATLFYDVVGVGVGIKGAYDTMEKAPAFSLVPINTGMPPSETVWPDKQTSVEKFLNLRAEIWWLARTRFEKTYERVVEGIDHPDEECVSIPNHPELIAQLSQPKAFHTETGKIKIESKEAMAKRGIESPDFADAFVMALAPVRVKKQISVVKWD